MAAAVGGSMGGARALEWAVTYPERTRAALVLAVGARATADQIGTQTTQSRPSRPTRPGRAATTTEPISHRPRAWAWHAASRT